MATSDLVDVKERAEVYLILMEEVRARLALINRALAPATGLSKAGAYFHPTLTREICQLQLRFLCEIIALAVTAAHGDLRRAKALRESYKPSEILKALEEINDEFYPRPITTKPMQPDGRSINFESMEGCLTREELVKLWAISGDALHRAPMAKAMKKLRPADTNLNDIVEWTNKIVALLNHHWVAIGNNQHMMVSLLTESGHAAASLITVDGQKLLFHNFLLE